LTGRNIMAVIHSRTIFLTTSPRTPEKIIPEIELLHANFAGQAWNTQTQSEFMKLLKEENFFNGAGANDPAFSARDRINRAPKSLGFVIISPAIKLTPAGLALIQERRKEEILLRQLLKFQILSPYHKTSPKSARFWIKPYLEIFRIIRHFGSLRFDELMIFGLQLTDYRKFNQIINKIESFRKAKVRNEGNYKKFRSEYFTRELKRIYKNEISAGDTKTRETQEASVHKFLKTKKNNMRDYADACIRYLRATGLINISQLGKSISINPESVRDVDYFLEHTPRSPKFVDDKEQYISYLGDDQFPVLLTDDRVLLEQKIRDNFPGVEFDFNADIKHIKAMLFDALETRKNNLLAEQIATIKKYHLFGEINTTFAQIVDDPVYDAPLMLEWNTWRAMTMLDGGDIKANLKFDDFGMPLSTAQGNMADIVCDYGDFCLAVEVTMQSGQKQYETESESVARHVAKLKNTTNKPTYGLFIAPKINEACIAHFFGLHKINIVYYGGTSTIVPLPLDIFLKMLDDSHKASYTSEPSDVQRFFERSNELAAISNNEKEWYDNIMQEALNWLNG